MVGKLSRADCERHMLTTGKDRDFVIRSSPHLVRVYTIQPNIFLCFRFRVGEAIMFPGCPAAAFVRSSGQIIIIEHRYLMNALNSFD